MSPSGWQNLSDLTLVLTIQNGGSLFYVLSCTEERNTKGTKDIREPSHKNFSKLPDDDSSCISLAPGKIFKYSPLGGSVSANRIIMEERENMYGIQLAGCYSCPQLELVALCFVF